MEDRTREEMQHREEWEVERVREVLQALGRVQPFRVEDLDREQVRECAEMAARSRRLRNPDFGMSRECLGQHREPAGRLSLDEVGTW